MSQDKTEPTDESIMANWRKFAAKEDGFCGELLRRLVSAGKISWFDLMSEFRISGTKIERLEAFPIPPLSSLIDGQLEVYARNTCIVIGIPNEQRFLERMKQALNERWVQLSVTKVYDNVKRFIDSGQIVIENFRDLLTYCYTQTLRLDSLPDDDVDKMRIGLGAAVFIAPGNFDDLVTELTTMLDKTAEECNRPDLKTSRDAQEQYVILTCWKSAVENYNLSLGLDINSIERL